MRTKLSGKPFITLFKQNQVFKFDTNTWTMIQRKLNVVQSLSETNFSVKYPDHGTAQIRKSRLQFLLIFYY